MLSPRHREPRDLISLVRLARLATGTVLGVKSGFGGGVCGGGSGGGGSGSGGFGGDALYVLAFSHGGALCVFAFKGGDAQAMLACSGGGDLPAVAAERLDPLKLAKYF